MLIPKKHGPGGAFFTVFRRRHDPETKAWGTKPLKQVLRWQRESRKLSLQGAAQFTGLPDKYLRLLEGAGEEQLLAEPLALIPCLQRYAVFLNVNPDLAVAQFIAELEQVASGAAVSSSVHRTQLLTSRPQPRARGVSRRLFLVLGFGLLTFGSYSVLTRKQNPLEDPGASHPPPLATAPALESVTPTPASSPTSAAAVADVKPSPPADLPPAGFPPKAGAPRAKPAAVSAPQDESWGKSSALQPQSPLADAHHRLHVQATEQTWLRVTIDGHRTQALLLQPGQSVQWSAESAFALILGNAGGVELTLDGQSLPPLGKSGQVVRVRLPA
jgi:cytoskeletal protein RodZ